MKALIEALRQIADIEANGNSEVDVMAAALELAKNTARCAVQTHAHSRAWDEVRRRFTVEIPGQHDVQVVQSGDEFTVTYGSEVRDGMSYEDAGNHFGHSIFHALSMNGVVSDQDEER